MMNEKVSRKVEDKFIKFKTIIQNNKTLQALYQKKTHTVAMTPLLLLLLYTKGLVGIFRACLTTSYFV